MISVIVLLSCSVMSYIIFTCKDVDMGLDVAAYTVLEDDRSVEVCASIMAGSLGVPVNVLLVTTDGTQFRGPRVSVLEGSHCTSFRFLESRSPADYTNY